MGTHITSFLPPPIPPPTLAIMEAAAMHTHLASPLTTAWALTGRDEGSLGGKGGGREGG